MVKDIGILDILTKMTEWISTINNLDMQKQH